MIRMGQLDDQIGVPRSAIAAVPFLLLPMVLGAAVLMVVPGSAIGGAGIVLSTVAVGWYLLGGAVALAHLRRRVAERRALSAIRGEVASASDAVWICDSDGQVLFQNGPATDRFGSFEGQNVVALLSRLRADAPAERDMLLRSVAHKGFGEIALEDGTSLQVSRAGDAPLQVWSCHDPASQIVGLGSAVEDEPGDGFDLIPVALLHLTSDGVILRANVAARELLGLSMTSDRDRHLAGLLEGPGRPLSDWIGDCFSGRSDNRTEILRRRSRDGREQFFQVSLARDTSGPGAVFAVLTDASDFKRLEAQFAQSQKMQAIGQLAGGVAHDFNNLLTAISGHCDLLMLRRDKGDPDYADLDQISQNTNRAAALVEQLLAFSRKQTQKLEVLNVRDTLADVSHLLNRLVEETVRLTIGVVAEVSV